MTQLQQKLILPPAISQKLDEVRRRTFKVRFGTALIAALGVMLAAMAVAMTVDWLATIYEFRWRALLTYSALVAAVATFLLFLLAARRHTSRLPRIAAQVDHQIPQLEERWSTVTSVTSNGHVETIHPAMFQQVSQEAQSWNQRVEVDRVVPLDGLVRALLALAAVTAVLGLALLMDSQRVSVLLRRFWNPYTPISATEITGVTGQQIVGRGESLDIEANLVGVPVTQATLMLVPEKGEEKTISLVPRGEAQDRLSHRLRSVKEPLRYRLRAGDGQTDWYEIVVADRPELANVRLTLTPPAYTRKEPKVIDKLPRRVTALEGSRVEIALKPKQTVDSVKLQFGEDLAEALSADEQGWYRWETTLTENFSFQPLLTESHGLSNLHPPTCEIRCRPDKPPVVKILTPNSQMAVRPDDKVPVTFVASDDVGVHYAELVVYDENNRVDGKPQVLDRIPVPLGDQQGEVQVKASVELDLSKYETADGGELSFSIRVREDRGQMLLAENTPATQPPTTPTVDPPRPPSAPAAQGADQEVMPGTDALAEAQPQPPADSPTPSAAAAEQPQSQDGAVAASNDEATSAQQDQPLPAQTADDSSEMSDGLATAEPSAATTESEQQEPAESETEGETSESILDGLGGLADMLPGALASRIAESLAGENPPTAEDLQKLLEEQPEVSEELASKIAERLANSEREPPAADQPEESTANTPATEEMAQDQSSNAATAGDEQATASPNSEMGRTTASRRQRLGANAPENQSAEQGASEIPEAGAQEMNNLQGEDQPEENSQADSDTLAEPRVGRGDERFDEGGFDEGAAGGEMPSEADQEATAQQNPGQQNPGQQNPGQQNPGQQNPNSQNPGQQNSNSQNSAQQGRQSQNSEMQEPSENQQAGSPQPGNPMTQRELDVPAQSSDSQRMKLKIDEWAGSYDGQQREKLEISIAPKLEALDQALEKAQSLSRAVLDEADAGKPWQSQHDRDLKRADEQVEAAIDVVESLEDETYGTPYAFIGLQLVDINQAHIGPARRDFWKGMQSEGSARLEAVRGGWQHINRARELLILLTERFERTRTEYRMADTMEEIKKMYRVYIEGAMALLRPEDEGSRYARKMVEFDLDEEYLKRLKEVMEAREKMLAELARILADDPRLLRRFLEAQRNQQTVLRNELDRLIEQQDELNRETRAWAAVEEQDREQLATVLLGRHVEAAQDLAISAAELNDRFETWSPLGKESQDAQFQETAVVLGEISTATRELSADGLEFVAQTQMARQKTEVEGEDAETSQVDESAFDPQASVQQIADQAQQLYEKFTQLEVLLRQIGNRQERPDLAYFATNRLLETRRLIEQTSAWIRQLQQHQAGNYHRAAEVAQYRLATQTDTMAGKLADMEQTLAGLLQRTDNKIPESIAVKSRGLLAALDEKAAPNQLAAVYALRRNQMSRSTSRQEAALAGLEEAGKLYDEMIEAAIKELDKLPVQDPIASLLDDPTLDELLRQLEQEIPLNEALGIPSRPSNLQIMSDWLRSGGDNSLMTGGNARQMLNQMYRQQQMRQRQLDRAYRRAVARALNEAQAEDLVADQPQLAKETADWNRLASELEDDLRQGRDKAPPERYRRAIEQYFRQVSGAGSDSE